MRVRLTGTDRWWVVGGVVAGAIAVVALAVLSGLTMIDLVVYRMGARALLHGTDIYAAAEPATGLVFTYPVFAAILFVPFTVVPLGVARVLLTAISLAALFIIMSMTVRRVRGAPSLPWSVPLSVAAIAVHPVWETFTFGQVNLILAAMVLLDAFVVTSRWRGALVGIATGIKLVPGLFIVWFLVTGQRRAALTAALTTAATMALGFAVQPGPSWEFWTQHVRDPERTGGVSYVTNQSILGVCARLLRDPQPPPGLALALSAAVVVAALVVARRLFRAGDAFLSVTVIGIASLLASPIAWSHHWVWVIPALGTLAAWALHPARPPGRWRWWVFGVAAAIVVTGPMQFMPKTDMRELHHTMPQQLVANSYAFLAVAYLVWAGVRAFRPLPASLANRDEPRPSTGHVAS